MRGACLLALMLLTTAGIGVVIKRLYWSSFDYNFNMHTYVWMYIAIRIVR